MVPGLTAVVCSKRQAALITRPAWVWSEAPWSDFGRGHGSRVDWVGGELLVGLVQLGLVLGDLLGVLIACRAGRAAAEQAAVCAARSAASADSAAPSMFWAMAVACPSDVDVSTSVVVSAAKGLLILGHGLLGLGHLLRAGPGRNGNGVRAFEADRTAYLNRVRQRRPYHRRRGQ